MSARAAAYAALAVAVLTSGLAACGDEDASGVDESRVIAWTVDRKVTADVAAPTCREGCGLPPYIARGTAYEQLIELRECQEINSILDAGADAEAVAFYCEGIEH